MASACLSGTRALKADFLIQPGDAVAICGASITEQKRYSVYLEDYLLMCRPTLGQTFVQEGLSGETTEGFLSRLDSDLFPFKPTVVTTAYGMNDGSYSVLTPAIADRYRKGDLLLVQKLRQGGVRLIVLGSPKCVDSYTFHDFGRGPLTPLTYNATLKGLADIDREVAQQEGVVYADVFGITDAAMKKSKSLYGETYDFGGPDGVHPNNNGHLVMAYAYLKALGCDGDIGTLTVDMGMNQAQGSPGQTVVSFQNGTLEVRSVRYPFCFRGQPNQPSQDEASMLNVIPFNQELNRYELVVKGLSTPNAKITWGTETKQFSADELKAGINLAAEFIPNPFNAAFEKVDAAVRAQQDYETPLIQKLLHNMPIMKKLLPEQSAALDAISAEGMKQDRTLFKAAANLVTPVDYTLKIEPSS